MEPRVEHYELAQFDFRSAVSALFGTTDLSTLGADDQIELLTRATDQSTTYHRAFYEAFDEHIAPLYREFVATFVPTVLGTKDFCFQRSPTFRVHLPGNVGVGEFHTDGDYNHRTGEVNF